MVEACRRDPGSLGFLNAIGWYITKHAVGCYSTTPPDAGFGRVDRVETQRAVDAQPRREPAGSYEGPVTVEATSVAFERDGTPSFAIVSTLTRDGRRALANSRDADLLVDVTTRPWEGRAVTLRTDGTTNQVVP
jgi:acetyl-CoA C-acetyltransferase